MCTFHLNGPLSLDDMVSTMVEQIHKELIQEKRAKSEALAVMSLPHAIPPGILERQIRKLGEIKEIVINPISHTVKVRYDPRVVSAEKVRVVLKKLGQGK